MDIPLAQNYLHTHLTRSRAAAPDPKLLLQKIFLRRVPTLKYAEQSERLEKNGV
jgi:hypothetical protein